MLRRAIVLVVVPVAMLCACASRQPSGVDFLRTHNPILGAVYAVPHGQMFSMTAAALDAEGYLIETRDSAEAKGWLVTAPQFTAPRCFKPQVREEVEQLGLGRVVFVRTIRTHDSTGVDIMSRVVR